MTHFIYHLIPEPMDGHRLIPLNEMDRNCSTFKANFEKYKDRENLTEQIIPILNCKWNDVVHFSSMNPSPIFKKMREISPKNPLRRRQYFKIPIPIANVINKHQTVLYTPTRDDDDYTISENEVRRLNTIRDYSEMTVIDDRSVLYWENSFRSNEVLLWFPFTPHVLVKGCVDVSSAEVFNVLD